MGLGTKRASRRRDGMHFGGGFQETADADDGQIMNHEEQMIAYCVHSLDKADNEMLGILQVKEGARASRERPLQPSATDSTKGRQMGDYGGWTMMRRGLRRSRCRKHATNANELSIRRRC